ncbi:MAG: DUF927 domain-containing protein [Thermodesulfobacteriota bacterium]
MGAIKLSPTPARQFIQALYGRFFSQAQGAAYLEVRGKVEGQGMSFRRFFRDPEALVKDMAGWKPGLNYWLGVALRKDSKGGAKANLLALTAAFADVDAGAAGHKQAAKYPDKAEALAAIEAFTLRPSLVVDSGGGYQPYWLFREPVSLIQGPQAGTPALLARLEGINRGLALALGGDVVATDAARILRFPGTFNMKLAGKPRPVKIVWSEPDRVYDLADFAEYEGQGRKQRTAGGDARPTGTPAPTGGTAPPGGGVGDCEAYAAKAMADEMAELARTPEGNRNARLNQAAFSLGQLVGAGVLDKGQVEAALYGVAVSIGLGEAETRATIRSGLDSGEKEPRALPEGARKGGDGQRPGDRPGSPKGSRQEGQNEPEVKKIWWVGHAYFIEKGRLCLEGFDRKGVPYTTALANFQARIIEEITRDDGLKRAKEFHVTGCLDTGKPLAPALIPATEFDSLKWIVREWGAAAAPAPGRSLPPHLVNAIKAHSQGFKRRTVYAHTGWRLVGDAWRYLHGGGAIGPGEDFEVDLGENLGNYRLPEPGGLEAAQASLRFLEIGPWEVTAPLLACAYLAPFADLLKIDFSLWLYGPSGSFKSTLAALALSHFGSFDRLTLPGSWFSTGNSLEKLCFTLKDSLIVIDDFMPAASAKDFHHMTEKAGRLLYQVGNRSGRGRLAPDLKARPNYFPRGLIISTGEVLLPGQRQSATARYLGVELDPKKTPIDLARLTAAQEEAPLYAMAMAAYLEDLAPRLEDVQEGVRDLWEGYRKAFRDKAHGKDHMRVPEIQAWLEVGFEYFLRFQTRMGTITEEQAYQMLNRAWGVFAALGEVHARRIEGERPTIKFIAVLRELFYTGRIFVESISYAGVAPPNPEALGWAGSEPKAKNAFPVGWADETTLYLLPETALRVVQEAIRAQGDFLGLGKNEMLAALAREGFIEPGKDGKNSQVKFIQQKSRRVIYLRLSKLAHDETEEDEQSNP